MPSCSLFRPDIAPAVAAFWQCSLRRTIFLYRVWQSVDGYPFAFAVLREQVIIAEIEFVDARQCNAQHDKDSG